VKTSRSYPPKTLEEAVRSPHHNIWLYSEKRPVNDGFEAVVKESREAIEFRKPDGGLFGPKTSIRSAD